MRAELPDLERAALDFPGPSHNTARMMETLCSTSGFTPDAALSSRQHTPPYNPARRSKRRLERSATPASRTSSTHPAETISPAKKIAKRSSTDNIKVEELTEGDMGYITDVDVVYPDELEENSTGSGSDDEGTMTNVSDAEAAGLTRRLSRLRCGDDREVDFEQLRQRIHQDKRNSRTYKRSHSQSVRNEAAMPDPEAMADHDVGISQRRLRRRTRGPGDAPSDISNGLPPSPTSGSGYVTAAEGDADLDSAEIPPTEPMDVDEEGD